MEAERGKVVASDMLTDRQKRFVFEYCKDFIATKAYIRAGYSEGGGDRAASKLLTNLEVQEAIEEQKEMFACVARLTPEWVLHQWMMIAGANPDDLVKVVVESCSECWAILDRQLPPNPCCTRCKGAGERFVSVTDTRLLSGAARRLYAGAVQTKDGIKILMRDQDSALKSLADYLGMSNKAQVSGPGGGPIPLLVATPADLSDEQLATIASAGVTQDGNMGVLMGVQPQASEPYIIDAAT